MEISTEKQIRQLMTNMKHMWFKLYTDRHASHVIQKFLHRIPLFLLRNQDPNAGKKKNNDDSDSDRFARTQRTRTEANKTCSVDRVTAQHKTTTTVHTHAHKHTRTKHSDSDDEDEMKDLPTIGECFAYMCEELRPHWVDVAFNVHGSYLLRDLLAILRGETELKKSGAYSRKKHINYNKSKRNQKEAGLKSRTHLEGFGDECLDGIVTSVLETCNNSQLVDMA